MAPEQGPDSKSKAEKTHQTASDEESDPHSDNSRHDKDMDSIGWIYMLQKEQLVQLCKNVGIHTAGCTSKILREELEEILRCKRLPDSAENLLRKMENEVKLSERTIIQHEYISQPVNATNQRPVQPDFNIVHTVLNWNIQFSGDSDLMEFLERIEELAECYQIHNDQLLPAMLAVLSGNALKWYRLKRAEIRTWAEFKNEIQKFFLPRRFFSQIEQKFYNRRQNNRERAKDFVLDMLDLARQHPDLRDRDHLDRIYDGLKPDYRHYIRRRDFSSLDELLSMIDDYEDLKREEKPQTSHLMARVKPTNDQPRWRCKKPICRLDISTSDKDERRQEDLSLNACPTIENKISPLPSSFVPVSKSPPPQPIALQSPLSKPIPTKARTKSLPTHTPASKLSLLKPTLKRSRHRLLSSQPFTLKPSLWCQPITTIPSSFYPSATTPNKYKPDREFYSAARSTTNKRSRSKTNRLYGHSAAENKFKTAAPIT